MEDAKDRNEIFSKRVRAGKRTYFFDIKATRSNDYYLTITESKRKYKDDGFSYEKHKIFLYKEDFAKFVNALNQTVNHVNDELMPDFDFDQFDSESEEFSMQQDDKEVDSELRWDWSWLLRNKKPRTPGLFLCFIYSIGQAVVHGFYSYICGLFSENQGFII